MGRNARRRKVDTIGSSESPGDEGDGAPAAELLMKVWEAEGGEVFYSKVRVGSETYTCGDCVMMDTDSGE